MSVQKNSVILDHLRLNGRMTRSVSISRDLTDALALDGYVLTPKVQETIAIISKVLRRGDTQRAWRIVGPYGSGKSALGLFISHLVQGPRASQLAFELLGKDSPANSDLRPGLGWLPVVITGARRSVLACVVDGLQEALSRISDAPKRTSVYATLQGALDVSSTANPKIKQIVEPFAYFAQSKGYNGLLFVFDELGKCLEHASLNSLEGDLYALQELAEMTYGQDPIPMAIIGLVHQHFEEYARDLSHHVSDEWGKVSSRYQEIAFDEPIDQYLTLIAETIGLDTKIAAGASFTKAARNRTEQLQAAQTELGALEVGRLSKIASRLYPLHPTCAIALPYIMKRFAQSERSLFAFLNEETAGSLRGYASRNAADPTSWYRLPDLYEYLSQGILRFRNSDTQRKWDYVLHIVSAGSLSKFESDVLKVLAIIECCGPISSLSAAMESLAVCLDVTAVDNQLQAAIERLVEEQILVKRRESGHFLIAMEDAVRIDSLQNEAHEGLSLNERQTYGLKRVLGRAAIANRHYHQTGTQRAFEARFGLISRSGIFLPPPSKRFDGSIVILLASPDCDATLAGKIFLESEVSLDTTTVYRIVRLDLRHTKQLHALSLWTRVYEIAQSRTADNWTMRHIDRQLEEAEVAVRRDILGDVESQASDRISPWTYCRKILEGSELSNVAQIASTLADILYPAAPKIFNELINKEKLSSQIALARQKLIEAMFQTPNKEMLGIEGFPPERAIYHSLLGATGIHISSGGATPFASPREADLSNIGPIWSYLDRMLHDGSLVTAESIFETFAQPPFGIRLGVGTVLFVAYLLSNKKALVLFERGTLVIEPTADHIFRLFKAPKNFAIRAIQGHVDKQQYLRKLAVDVRLFSDKAEGMDPLALTRTLVIWSSQLSTYAQGTLNISKDAKALRSTIRRATDPVVLLCESLPEAVGGATTEDAIDSTIKAINAAIDDLGSADRKLRDRVTEMLGGAFSINGGLPTIRTMLARECQGPNLTAVDYRLKSFVTRCIDPALTDEKWLESIAGLVAQRSMESWTDEVSDHFALEIKGLASQLRRWMDLMLDRGRTVNGAERLMRIAITDGNGQEYREVFYKGTIDEKSKQDALAAIAKATGLNVENLGPILATLYLDFANKDAAQTRETTNHG